MRILVTRPEDAGERTAARLRGHGHDVLLAPLLRVELLAPDLGVGPWRGVVLTSSNAVAAIARHPRVAELTPLPAFTVGARTAAAARQAGFRAVTSADGAARDLADLIVAATRRVDNDPVATANLAPLMYLAGEDRTGDLERELAAAGLPVSLIAVYRAAKATTFPANARAALADGRIDAVLHYSARSAEAYLDCASAACILEPSLAPIHFCLSAQVAEPLIAAGARRISIAATPAENSLINLLVSK